MPQPAVGEIWAYRERVSETSLPLIPAEVIKLGPSRSWKARVRWAGGEYEGLEQWVTTRRLLVLWKESEAWLRDEELYARVRAASMDADIIEHRAAWRAFYTDESLLELEDYDPAKGSVVRIPDLAAACEALDLDMQALLSEPLSFVDRNGEYVAAWSVALRLAKHTARGTRFRWGKDGPEYFVPPDVHAKRLREWAPAFALVREWCGGAPSEDFDRVAALEQEICRLQKVIEEAASEFRHRRHYRLAKRLLALANPDSQESLEMREIAEMVARAENEPPWGWPAPSSSE